MFPLDRLHRLTGTVVFVLAWILAGVVPVSAHGPGDSRAVFQEVQRLLQRGAFVEVVTLLDHAERDHPYDDVIARARHWRAFARWRMGDAENLRAAKDDLALLVRDHPDVAVGLDTIALCERVARSFDAIDDPWAAAEVETLAERLREHAEALEIDR